MDAAEECLRQGRAGGGVCTGDGSGGAENLVAGQGATGGEG
jgi:hypothetical protein